MQTKESRARLAAALALLLIVSFLVASAAQGAPSSRQEGDSVILEVSPWDRIVAVGSTFTVRVMVHAGAYEIDGAQVFMDFDPACLQVLSVTPGRQLQESFPWPLAPFDNALGHINHNAFVLYGPAPSGTFELMTIEFRATNLNINAPLVFVQARDAGGPQPLSLKITSRGNMLPVITRDGRIIIANATPTPSPEPTCVGTCTPVWHRLRVPLILRSFWP